MNDPWDDVDGPIDTSTRTEDARSSSKALTLIDAGRGVIRVGGVSNVATALHILLQVLVKCLKVTPHPYVLLCQRPGTFPVHCAHSTECDSSGTPHTTLWVVANSVPECLTRLYFCTTYLEAQHMQTFAALRIDTVAKSLV